MQNYEKNGIYARIIYVFCFFSETYEKNVGFFLVLCSLIRTIDFVESTLARQKKEKKLFSFGFVLTYSYLCTAFFSTNGFRVMVN